MVYSLPANTSADGADAIHITDAFRGKVTIENYGTIAGGGGGATTMRLAPPRSVELVVRLGPGAAVPSGTNNRNGLAGSRDKGGATQLVVAQFTGYQSRYYGGPVAIGANRDDIQRSSNGTPRLPARRSMSTVVKTGCHGLALGWQAKPSVGIKVSSTGYPSER